MSLDLKGKEEMMEMRKSPSEIDGRMYHRSASFQCPSVSFTLSSSHISPKFQLLIRQDPIKGFSAGMDIAARKNARITPLDPPPICEMIVLPFEKEGDQMDEIQSAKYLSTVEVCVYVCLVKVEEPNIEIQDKNLDPNGILLVGNLVESPFIAPCTSPMLKDECFFIFSELSVKCSGQYRLRYNLIDRANNQFRKLASVLGDPFTVYPQKKRFGNFIESSCLMKDIVARGLRLRVSKGSQTSREEKQEQQEQQNKKKRKISDNCELHLPSHNQPQFLESRPMTISDCNDSIIQSNEYLPPLHRQTISSFYSTTEKPEILPLSSSSSSSSRLTHTNESTSEAFYPAVSGIHFKSTLSNKMEKKSSNEGRDSKRERYDLEWSRRSEEKDENWQTKRRSSFTPSYTLNRMATHDGYQLHDELQRDKNNSRPLSIGDRYQSTEYGWHTSCIRSSSFHSHHHNHPYGNVLKSERWQDIPPILPPLHNNQPKPYSLEFEERQRKRSSNGFHNDFKQYALSKKYEATNLDPRSDYSRKDHY